jgi:hypothetical protein
MRFAIPTGPLDARRSASAVRPPLYPGLPPALRVARYRGLEPCENLFTARTGEGGRPLESTGGLPVPRRRRVPVPAEGDIDEYEYGDGYRYVDEYGYRGPGTGTSTSTMSTSRTSGSSHGEGSPHPCRQARARVAPWSPAGAERSPDLVAVSRLDPPGRSHLGGAPSASTGYRRGRPPGRARAGTATRARESLPVAGPFEPGPAEELRLGERVPGRRRSPSPTRATRSPGCTGGDPPAPVLSPPSPLAFPWSGRGASLEFSTATRPGGPASPVLIPRSVTGRSESGVDRRGELPRR